MAPIGYPEAELALGRIRWQGGSPTLFGRAIGVGSRLQVFVKLPAPTSTATDPEGVWLDADVMSIAPGEVELRTSFARFIAEETIVCRWPPDSAPLSRRELERIFAESTTDVCAELQSLVDRFQADPQLRTSPLEQLLAYANAVRGCARHVEAIAALIDSVSGDLSSQSNRSMLVVAQPPRAADGSGGKRF